VYHRIIHRCHCVQAESCSRPDPVPYKGRTGAASPRAGARTTVAGNAWHRATPFWPGSDSD
jgi:hypothetical protein